MIYQQTILNVADNSGAKLVKCIGMLGQNRVASVGRVISVSVKQVSENAKDPKVKQGEVHRALVVRTKKPVLRPDGRRVCFDDNAAILLSKDFSPIGTRISGPVAMELKRGNWAKVLSLVTHVLWHPGASIGLHLYKYIYLSRFV